MSYVTSKSLVECDECGKRGCRIQRVYDGHRFCGTCYKRVFRKTICPQCHQEKRIPKNISGAICRECKVNKPCVRCEKTIRRLGKVATFGPVCASCAKYFREPKRCDICGDESRYTTTIFNRIVCEKCDKRKKGTCHYCRRYRRLIETNGKDKICLKCHSEGLRRCLRCGEEMFSGYGETCESCYWRSAYDSRVSINSHLFSGKKMKQSFDEFSSWLIVDQGPKKASLKINRYSTFLQEWDAVWGRLPCSYKDLVSHFGPDALRRYSIALRWLSSAGHIIVDDEHKSIESEQRRINTLLSKLAVDSKGYEIANMYRNMLMEKDGTSLRSVRNALTAAVGFLKLSNGDKASKPSQKDLMAYLLNKPGQRASITGFLNYLKSGHGINLKLPDKNLASTQRNKILENRILKIMEDRSIKVTQKQWIHLCLEYFHGMKPGEVRSLNINATVDEESSSIIRSNGQSYWIPPLRRAN